MRAQSQLEVDYQVRFTPSCDAHKLVNLYHLARTALSKQECTPYKRMIWAAEQYVRENTNVSVTGAYKDLCGLLSR
jgi:hypothetical protein